jgi:adenosylcobinamide-GDP ribazoletransferase
VGFLTRLPIGADGQSWEAFRRRPYVLPLVGYPLGLLAGVALLLPPATAAAAYPVAVYLLAGINHADGLADLGDAAAVHGGPDRRRSVLKDTTVGVGAVVAVGVSLVGLAAGALAAAGLPARGALAVAVAAEVGAKLSMATLAGAGRPSHDGLGAQLLGATRGDAALAAVLAVPAALCAWPSVAAAAAVAAGPAVALALLWWADAALGGASGDVFGASNELARVAGLHAGVVAWTLS